MSAPDAEAGSRTGRIKVSMPFRPTELIPSSLSPLLLLRVVLIAHFLLISVALTGNWHSFAYPFYNGFLIAGLLWVQPSESVLPLGALLALEGVAVVLDVVVMGVGTMILRAGSYWGWNGFTLFAAILNLIVRLPASLILLKVRQDRQPPPADDFSDPQPGHNPHFAAPSPPPVYQHP